jgi:hypothetical protein
MVARRLHWQPRIRAPAERAIFRTRGAGITKKDGKPQKPAPYSKNKLAEDFRTIRTAEFGEA